MCPFPVSIRFEVLCEWLCAMLWACVCMWDKVCNTWLILHLTSELSTCVLLLSPGYTAVHCMSCKHVFIPCKHIMVFHIIRADIIVCWKHFSKLQAMRALKQRLKKKIPPLPVPRPSRRLDQRSRCGTQMSETCFPLKLISFRLSPLLWVDLGSAGKQLVPAHHSLA